MLDLGIIRLGVMTLIQGSIVFPSVDIDAEMQSFEPFSGIPALGSAMTTKGFASEDWSWERGMRRELQMIPFHLSILST